MTRFDAFHHNDLPLLLTGEPAASALTWAVVESPTSDEPIDESLTGPLVVTAPGVRRLVIPGAALATLAPQQTYPLVVRAGSSGTFRAVAELFVRAVRPL